MLAGRCEFHLSYFWTSCKTEVRLAQTSNVTSLRWSSSERANLAFGNGGMAFLSKIYGRLRTYRGPDFRFHGFKKILD